MTRETNKHVFIVVSQSRSGLSRAPAEYFELRDMCACVVLTHQHPNQTSGSRLEFTFLQEFQDELQESQKEGEEEQKAISAGDEKPPAAAEEKKSE